MLDDTIGSVDNITERYCNKILKVTGRQTKQDTRRDLLHKTWMKS
jgi:hypothetical protein